MIKSTIAALAATPLLFSGAAFAGPYVNVEASGSYPDGAYESGTWEFQLGYEGTTPVSYTHLTLPTICSV